MAEYTLPTLRPFSTPLGRGWASHSYVLDQITDPVLVLTCSTTQVLGFPEGARQVQYSKRSHKMAIAVQALVLSPYVRTCLPKDSHPAIPHSLQHTTPTLQELFLIFTAKEAFASTTGIYVFKQLDPYVLPGIHNSLRC